MPYRKHFGLTRHPFDKDLAETDLFETTALAELTARLRHLLDMRGIGLVTGESGSGKTTAYRRLVAGLNTGLHRGVADYRSAVNDARRVVGELTELAR